MGAKDQFLQIRVTPAEKAAIRRRAERAGMDMSSWVLRRVMPAPHAEFQRLAAGLKSPPEERKFALAAMNDFLSGLSRREFELATDEPPAEELEPFAANYLAAMVETVAHRLGLPAPEWAGGVEPLGVPWFGASGMTLRLYLLTHSPPAFRRRNIFIDSTVGDRI